MADKAIAKVMKFELRYLSGCKDFYDMQHRVWSLQNDTWKILNKTIQMAYMWEAESRAQAEATGIYKDVKEETGYKTLDGYIYDQLKGSFPLINTANLIATIRTAWKRFKDSKMDVFHGEVSLPSYKKDHPLVLHNRTVKLQKEDTDCVAEISLFSNEVKADEIGTRVKFAVLVKDGTQRNIVDRFAQGGIHAWPMFSFLREEKVVPPCDLSLRSCSSAVGL